MQSSAKNGTTNWSAWYNDFDKNYSPEKRRQWYSAAAQAYSWARPHYPNSLVDLSLKKAKLKSGHSVLEIGCGPGIATQSFAAKGLVMQSVEPSPAACELARENCKAYDTLTITNTTFEEFPLAGRQYDAVLAATSFHWVSPDVACQKSAAALKPNGSLILLWATPPQPNAELSEFLQPIYEQHQLTDKIRYQWRGQDYYQANFEEFARLVGHSGLFAHTKVEIETHHSRYSIEKYLALLSTLSDYIALPEERRKNLLVALATRLEARYGDKPLPLIHWFAAQVAPLISS